MNQSQLARALSDELGTRIPVSEELVRTFVQVLGRTLAQGESITISNFGTFRPGRRKAKAITPPDRVDGEARNELRVHFRPSDRLLEAVRRSDPHVTFQKRPGELPRA